MEQRLPGGRNDGAVLVGGTVRRRTGAHTPAVHALLRHLRAVDFDRAPQVLGIDGSGREVLTHLPGETVGDARPWPRWPRWAHGDAALVAAGRWLRDLHDASRSFVPPPGARWFGDHDAAPYNAVWDPAASGRGELVGFVDWTWPVRPRRCATWRSRR